MPATRRDAIATFARLSCAAKFAAQRAMASSAVTAANLLGGTAGLAIMYLMALMV